MRRAASTTGSLAGAALLLYAFWNARDWSWNYSIRYGSFVMSGGDLAMRLNLVVLALPAAILMSAAAAMLAGPRILAKFERLAPPPWWPVLLGAWVLLASAAIRLFVLHRTGVTDDENVYEFQARLIETGRLYASSLPLPLRAFFDNQYIVNDGRWYGSYFVGHPAVLALGSRVGLLDWVGPIEAAATALTAVGTARRVFGGRAALISGILLALSPLFLCVSATHLSQPTSALFLTAFLYSVVRIRETPTHSRWWALAASAISLAALTRPQTAVAFFASGVLLLLWDIGRGRIRPGLRPLAVAMGVGSLGLGAFLWVNAARSGHPLRTGYAAYMAQGHPWSIPFGFGRSVGQVEQGLNHLNFWLFGWPISLAFAPFFRRTAASLQLAGAFLATLILYAVSGIPAVAPVGPVYYAECVPVLAMLSASGIETTVEWARAKLGGSGAAALAMLPATLALTGLVTFWPVEWRSMEAMATLTRAPDRLVEERGLQNVVIFVSASQGVGELLPGSVFPPGTWAYFHRNPDPDLNDPVLFVRDLGPSLDRTLLQSLRGRKGFRLVFHKSERTFSLDPLEP